MPSISSLKHTAQHVRQRQNRPIALPANLIDLQIPNQYSTTLAGASFLLYDSGPEPYHMLIFSTAANMQLLSESQHWYGDGTFKTAPLLFEQLYTIHRIQPLHRSVQNGFCMLYRDGRSWFYACIIWICYREVQNDMRNYWKI
uniref:Uncharacterized protein n=1 Tax=Romanomermis culicivorax TaxID=13658 RepID=A0A915K4S7_ROMCU